MQAVREVRNCLCLLELGKRVKAEMKLFVSVSIYGKQNDVSTNWILAGESRGTKSSIVTCTQATIYD